MTRDSKNGTIHPDILYTIGGVKQRLGISDATLRAARRAGLPVCYKHGRGFIFGADLIRYLLSPSDGKEAILPTQPGTSWNNR